MKQVMQQLNKTFSLRGCIVVSLGIFLLPLSSHAQLTSTNYQIDSYSIGENVAAFGTSTNYQVGIGVTNFEFSDTPPVGSSGGSSGSRRSDNGVSDATTTKDTELAPEVVIDDLIVPSSIAPYVRPIAKQYVQPPESLVNVSPGDIITFTPIYKATDPARSNDVTSVKFFQVINDRVSVYITVPNSAFVIPNDYFSDDIYKVYIAITEHNLLAAQTPAQEQAVVLLGSKVYSISFIDSRNQQLEYSEALIEVEMQISGTLDYSIDTSGYFFNIASNNWIRIADMVFTNTSAIFTLQKPTLVGLWAGAYLPNVLALKVDATTDVHQQTELTPVPVVVPEVTPWWHLCIYIPFLHLEILCWIIPFLIMALFIYTVRHLYLKVTNNS